MEKDLKLGSQIEGFALTLCNCNAVSDAITAIERLKTVVRFLDPRPNNPDRTLIHPEKTRIEDNGSVMVRLLITHPFLARDATSMGANWSIAVAGMTYHAPSNSVQIRQINSPQGETSEDLVQGLLKLAEILAPAVGAIYGTLDIWTSVLKPRLVRNFVDIRYWCYANVLSEQLIAKAPERFVEQIPCATKVLLSDRSHLLTSCGSFANWYFSKPDKIEKFLVDNAPNIRIFRQTRK